MKTLFPLVLLPVLSQLAFAAEPALTIYNQQFAVVREKVPLELRVGVNEVSFSGMTALAEPHTVIFRDPSGKVPLTILTQSYRNDPVSQEALLRFFEGKTIKFLVTRGDKQEVVEGKIIRGADMGWIAAMDQYRSNRGGSYPTAGPGQPLIEVAGELRFGLPGEPVFPKLADDSILQPTLTWKLESPQAGKLDAELGYLTRGFEWIADYNVVAGEQGDDVELTGFVSIANRSGTAFREARVKLLAGDVNRVMAEQGSFAAVLDSTPPLKETKPRGPRVTEKAVDEYHIYSLPEPITLRDRETVQVEFVRSEKVKAQRFYVYDGVQIPNGRDYDGERMRDNPAYGTDSNPAVWVMREFRNSEANHLGVPLPRGRIRFYRTDGPQLEFTGENLIPHTAQDEWIRVYTGDSFDLTGERARTDFSRDESRRSVTEAFAIKLRNHKKEPVEIRVVEHLYRGAGWEITEKSNAFVKRDSQTVEFRVQVKPGEEKAVTYRVHYAW